MSDLTLHQNVASYAYYKGCYNHELEVARKTGIINRQAMVYYKFKMSNVEEDPNVIKYIELESKLDEIDDAIADYYQTITIDLRDSDIISFAPNIFVFQGYVNRGERLKVAKHIIFPEVEQVFTATPDTIIYPVIEFTSNRKLRHFYNRTIFNYLEQMTIDESFDVKTKKLGKIRVE